MKTNRQLMLTMTIALGLAGCTGSNPSNQSGTDAAVQPAAPAVPLTKDEAALIDAAVKGDNVQITNLLAAGVNVNVRDSTGGTPLAHAAWFGRVDTVKLLIEKGADLNAKKNDGGTPVLLATWNKHPEVAEILKKAGAK